MLDLIFWSYSIVPGSVSRFLFCYSISTNLIIVHTNIIILLQPFIFIFDVDHSIIIIITKLFCCTAMVLTKLKYFQTSHFLPTETEITNLQWWRRTGATISRNDINVTTHPSRNKRNITRWTTPTSSLNVPFYDGIKIRDACPRMLE